MGVHAVVLTAHVNEKDEASVSKYFQILLTCQAYINLENKGLKPMIPQQNSPDIFQSGETVIFLRNGVSLHSLSVKVCYMSNVYVKFVDI